MKFQKLSENKLKIVISSGELSDYRCFDDFIANSSDARNSFLQILDRACDEVGFNTKNYKIKIDASVLNNGNFVFIVTKLLKLKQNKLAVKPRRIPKDTASTDNNIAIYKFDKFDDFYNFCAYLKAINLSDIRKLAKSAKLYTYNGAYYLSICSINNSYKNIGKFYSSITEFSKFFSSKDLFMCVLDEKGNLVIENNAIINCMKKL